MGLVWLGRDVVAQVVLRVRLTGGYDIDVVYEGSDADPGAVIDQVVAALAQDNGVLRARHGDRLVVLYGRNLAAVEVAPRGAVL